MVIGAFPLAKVVILGVKQITKPICKIVKVFAKNNRLFKTCLCAPAGQLIYWIEARSKLQMLRLPQPKRIRPLTEERATELGANLISEILVVGIGLGLIFFEKSRQALKDKKKHDDHVREKNELIEKVSTLSHLLDWEENELRIMNQYFSEYFTNFDK